MHRALQGVQVVCKGGGLGQRAALGLQHRGVEAGVTQAQGLPRLRRPPAQHANVSPCGQRQRQQQAQVSERHARTRVAVYGKGMPVVVDRQGKFEGV